MKRKHLLLIALLLSSHGAASAANRLCLATAVPGARRLIKATCADVGHRLARVPGAAVRTTWKSFVDARSECTREGCVVKLEGSFQALKNEASPDTWLGEYLETKGWSRILSRDADGPDGTIYALHQPGALCIVQGTWNHWHDDSGSHTADAYEVTVSCGGAEESAPEP